MLRKAIPEDLQMVAEEISEGSVTLNALSVADVKVAIQRDRFS
jgi:hypothetical protein